MANRPPQYDQAGLNVLDPNDTLGYKSTYITLIQELALKQHLPEGPGTALDVGCGYGRLSSILKQKGWHVTGIDPDPALLAYARQHYAEIEFHLGALPQLPVAPNSVDLMLCHNLLRALKRMNQMEYLQGCGAFVAPKGHLVVVENIWHRHPEYVSERELLTRFQAEGFQLQQRIPIRAGRWWLLYLMRYGLVAQSWFPAIAQYELRLRAKTQINSKWRYFNVLYLFIKI